MLLRFSFLFRLYDDSVSLTRYFCMFYGYYLIPLFLHHQPTNHPIHQPNNSKKNFDESFSFKMNTKKYIFQNRKKFIRSPIFYIFFLFWLCFVTNSQFHHDHIVYFALYISRVVHSQKIHIP